MTEGIINIKFSKEVSDFIKDHSCVSVKGEKYYYNPTYYLQVGENIFKPLREDELPEYAKVFFVTNYEEELLNKIKEQQDLINNLLGIK